MVQRRLVRSIAASSFWLATAATPVAALEVDIRYVRQEVEPPATLSELDVLPDDLGVAGAELGLSDNATTGQFLGQTFTLDVATVPVGGDFGAALSEAAAAGGLVLVDAPAEAVLAAADLARETGALLFNVSAPDDDLRGKSCRANVLHTLPSRAMLADGLMQFLVWKQWRDIALVTGPHEGDRAFGAALEASAQKFGLEIGSRADWSIDADLRRSAATEVAALTQELGEFDVLLVADEAQDFGRYMLYNTWLPRPVAGSEGLVPSAWAPVIEQWGAVQLQNRFRDAAGRHMRDVDYAAWAAMRAIGEAVTRTGRADAPAIRDYLLGDAFELAGFKGEPLSFRPWDGQLRQPIALAHPRALAAQAPLEGFLHQTNPLDTLGPDAPETQCREFAP